MGFCRPEHTGLGDKAAALRVTYKDKTTYITVVCWRGDQELQQTGEYRPPRLWSDEKKLKFTAKVSILIFKSD